MAQLLIRNIDEEIKERLRRRAALHGHSMEEEARLILSSALNVEETTRGFGSESVALFKDLGLPKGTIREIRGIPFTTRPLPFQDGNDG